MNESKKAEQERAEQVSAAIDELVRDSGARPVTDEADAPLIETARRLAAAVERLDAPGAVLEQRVAALSRRRGLRPAMRPAWAAATLAAVLLVATLLTPVGQTALAGFMSVFRLGRTEVHITPAVANTVSVTATPEGGAVRTDTTLAGARAQLGQAIPRPAALPPGYQLERVSTYTYPDLPAWIRQPFIVELVYSDGQAHRARLRAYPISLGDHASISHLNLEAAPIHDVEDVDVSGHPGVLLRVGPAGGQVEWQEVVWEQGDLVVSLSADGLAEAELLDMARSVK